MKKNCELCKCTARVYCESDQASLCWSCDSRVHSANFLVARHVRALLCNFCQSPTPWNASGEKLGRTISVCQTCASGCRRARRNKAESGCVVDDDDDSESGIDYDPDEQKLDLKVEDIDNQVVPLASSQSTSSNTTGRDRPQIDINISPEKSNDHESHLNSEDDLDTQSKCARPFKLRKLDGNRRSENCSSRDEDVGDRRAVSDGETHESLDLDLNECPPN